MICHDCASGQHKPCKKRTKTMIDNGGYGSCDCQHKSGTQVQAAPTKKEDS